MEAVRYRQVDLDYRNHLQAWLTFAAKAKKQVGKKKEKPVFDEFEKFFNYEDAIEAAREKSSDKKERKSRFSGIGKLLKKGGGDNGG